MWTFLLLIGSIHLLGSNALGSEVSDQEGNRSMAIEARMIREFEPKLGSYPWLALLGKRLGKEKKIDFLCGGSLINEKYVLTASHCFLPMKGIEVYIDVIRLGEHEIGQDPDCRTSVYEVSRRCADSAVDVAPKNVILHEGYNPYTYQHDIALVELEAEVKFTDWIFPIPLPEESMEEKNFHLSQAMVAGWGMSPTVHAAQYRTMRNRILKVFPMPICWPYYAKWRVSESKQMCVGRILGGGSFTGDDGGPLMIKERIMSYKKYYVIVGIMSYGGENMIPIIFTKVGAHLHWIAINTKQTKGTIPTTQTAPTTKTEPTTPIEPTKKTEPTTPIEPTPKTKSTTPIEPTTNIEPTTPIEPTPNTEPTTPREPTTMTESTKQRELTQPTITNSPIGDANEQ